MYSVIQHKLAQHFCHMIILCTYSKYDTCTRLGRFRCMYICVINIWDLRVVSSACGRPAGRENCSEGSAGWTHRRGNEAAAMTHPPRPRDSLVFLGLGPRLLWGLWLTSPPVFAHGDDDVAHQDEVGRNDRRNRRKRGVLCARRRLSGHGMRGDGTHRPRGSAARGSRNRWG